MKVLGIDTSAVVCSVALVSDGVCIREKTSSDGLTHSQTLLPSIKDVLSEADCALDQLDGISISAGPGSFTGLRIGISTVKGLAASKNLPCIGVSTLEALAMNAIKHEGATICPVMDARRGEFYNALFRVENGALTRLCADRAIQGSLLASQIASEEKLFILGDGALKFAEQNPAFATNLAREEFRLQSGKSVATLGEMLIKQGKQSTCHELSPKYLRLPQAEREWNEKNKKTEEKK